MQAAAGVEVVGDGGGGGHGLFRGGRGTGGQGDEGSLFKGDMVETSCWQKCGEMGGWWKGRENMGPGGGYMLGVGGVRQWDCFLCGGQRVWGSGFLVFVSGVRHCE